MNNQHAINQLASNQLQNEFRHTDWVIHSHLYDLRAVGIEPKPADIQRAKRTLAYAGAVVHDAVMDLVADVLGRERLPRVYGEGE